MKGFGKSIFAKFMSVLLVACVIAVTFSASANARFISPDNWDPTKPGVGTNRYAYSENDPINKSDPNGHIWGLIGWGIGILGGLLSSSTPANAPGPDDKVEPSNEGQAMANMAAGVCTGVCGPGMRTAIGIMNKTKDDIKKETLRTEQETTTLYRSVNKDEAKQIAKTGKFQQGTNSLEGKWMAETAEDAKKWGKIMNGDDSVVMEVKMPKTLADQLQRVPRLDGIGSARYGTLDQLSNVTIRELGE